MQKAEILIARIDSFFISFWIAGKRDEMMSVMAINENSSIYIVVLNQ
jgi:hypothetical protein